MSHYSSSQAVKMLFRFTLQVLFIHFIFASPIRGQETPWYLTDVTLHVGDGSRIDHAVLAFQNGKIVYAGAASEWAPPADARLIKAKGKEIYPGIIAPNTTLGLREYEQVRATNDFRELGQNNANIRSLIAYNTESSVIPTVRSNGVLYAQIVPQGGLISGRSSIVHLTGHNWEDAVTLSDNGLHIHWPTQKLKQGWWGDPKPGKPNTQYHEQRQYILQYFHDAKAWCNGPSLPNIKLQAFCDLEKSNGTLYIHANHPFEIKDAVTSLSFLGRPMVIIGGKEAWRIGHFLKKQHVSVIYIQPHSLPDRLGDPVHRPYSIPKKLDSAGVTYCLAINGFWQVRNLPFVAGQSVAMGLEYEKAVRSITGDAAQILGLDGITGQLKAGLSADFIVSSGDVLDMKSSTISQAYLHGQPVDLDDKQKRLYRKYMKRYKLEN